MITLSDQLPVEVPGSLLEKAQKYPAIPAVVANAGSELVMRSAFKAAQLGLIKPILVGDVSLMKKIADGLSWDLSEIRLEQANTEHDCVNRAVAIARGHEAQAIVKGDVHTDTLLRGVLNRDTGLRTERQLSHVFHMTVPGTDNALCISDAVLNVLPTFEQKQHILFNAVSLLHALGHQKPKVALLSATEQPNSAMPSSIDADKMISLAAEQGWTGMDIAGPLAFDLCVSEDAARIKGVTSKVAGNADLVLVPNIETGNALFKMLVYFNSAAAAGIVLGATVPIMLTSRADTMESRIASAALTAIYAGYEHD